MPLNNFGYETQLKKIEFIKKLFLKKLLKKNIEFIKKLKKKFKKNQLIKVVDFWRKNFQGRPDQIGILIFNKLLLKTSSKHGMKYFLKDSISKKIIFFFKDNLTKRQIAEKSKIVQIIFFKNFVLCDHWKNLKF